MRELVNLRSFRLGVSGVSAIEKLGVAIVVAMLLLVPLGSVIAPFGAEEIIAGTRLEPPSLRHPFGTDQNGMDIFSRTLVAPRFGVTIGLTATGLAIAVGSSLGLVAGYIGGGARVLIRMSDAFQAFPVFILAMAVMAFLGQSILNIILVIGFINVPVYARLSYAQAVKLRSLAFVKAAQIEGYPHWRVIVRHILPNAFPTIMALASVTVGWTVLLTAGLSFVGAGLRPPTAEWGAMIAVGVNDLVLGFWWPPVFPGAALALAVFGFSTTGELVSRKLGRTAA